MVNRLIEVLLIAVQSPLLVMGALLAFYLLVITLAPFFIRRGKKVEPGSKKKFAIIIPAHNEEKVIEGTIRSARKIAYPEELFDIIVVADNCTDETAKVALANGAIVFERHDTTKRGKGYALNWIIPQVMDRLPKYDACVFVDADSVLSTNFLAEMNSSLHEGHRIIQSSDLVLDNSNQWRVQLMLIAFALQNYVRPLGKSCLGFSTPLKGNGMCFSSEVLRMMKWDEASLGEDLDMGLDLVRRGEKIHFNPRAVVHAIMPTHAASAATQRIRWEGGRFSTMRHRVPAVLRDAWKRKSLYILEAAIDAAYPPLAILLLGSSVFAGMNWVLLQIGIQSSPVMFWSWLAVIVMILLHCVLGMVLARVHPRNLLAFLYVPRYFLWKIGVYFSMLFGKSTKTWVRTER